MVGDYTPLRGSTADRAITALREHGGPLTAPVLSEQVDVDSKQIHQLLATAVLHQLIIKTVRIAPGLRGGRQVLFSLPEDGLGSTAPQYGDAAERAADEQEQAKPAITRPRKSLDVPAPAAAAPVLPIRPEKPASAEPAQPADDLGIEYAPLAEANRRPVGYWDQRLNALAAAPIKAGGQLPTLRFPLDKHKAAESALRTWRKRSKPTAELRCIRTHDQALIQRVA